jgi:hypothetical protein
MSGYVIACFALLFVLSVVALVGVLVGVTIAAGVYQTKWRVFGVALALTAVVVPMAVGLWVLPLLNSTYDELQCAAWGESVERDVRFVRINHFDWSCLTHTDEGWVGRDRIVKVDD